MKKLIALILIIVSSAAYAFVTSDDIYQGIKTKVITYDGSLTPYVGQEALMVLVDSPVLETPICHMLFITEGIATIKDLQATNADANGFVTALQILNSALVAVPMDEVRPICYEVYRPSPLIGSVYGIGYDLTTEQLVNVDTVGDCRNDPYVNPEWDIQISDTKAWHYVTDSLIAICERV